MVCISYIKLVRINITPYLRQKAEKGMSRKGLRPFFIGLSVAHSHSASKVVRCGRVVLRVTTCRVALVWYLKAYM
jgi:hypothetical protein